MKPQEIFTKAVTHLMTQNAKSLVEGDYCAYRGKDGTMCAVGVFIKDNEYDPELEGAGVNDKSIKQALQASGIICTDEQLDLLEDLQQIHDRSEVDAWKETLTAYAETHGLEMP